MEINNLKEAIGLIVDKFSNLSLDELDAIKKLTILSNKVVNIEIELPNVLHEDEIKREISKIVKVDFAYPGVKINIFKSQEAIEEEELTNSKIKYIAIASGKGGVGKSTVTANLAIALQRLGKKVGIIDVDIYGASIPLILGQEIVPLDLNENEELIPSNFNGIEIISTEFFVPKNQPLMWRAPLASQMTKMFFDSVAWSTETEIVLIDMPPGTGDIAIDVRELVPKSDMIIVTNPNMQAANVAVKAGLGSKEIGHNIIGVIENMSYYYNACSKEKDFLFGNGGGSFVAKELSVDLLAEIPITAPNETNNIYELNTMQAKIYQMLAYNIIKE